jgi:peroxiredoxin (alkyl hydroperoxide reductase subunit C)
LDEEGFEFSIDVASAGVSSPLKLVRQYKKNVGRKLKVKTISQGEIEGMLVEADDEGAAENYEEFKKAGAEVYIVTTDTHFSHKVWHETSPAVGKAQFPLVGDPTHQLTRAFDVHIEEAGLALRGTFIINPEGVIKTAEIHDNAIARDVSETLRKLKAAQFVASHPGEVCPAKWKEGEATLAPSIDLVGKI